MVWISRHLQKSNTCFCCMTDKGLLQCSKNQYVFQQITIKGILLPWFFSHVWWYWAQYSLHHCKMFSVFVCLKQTQIYAVVRIKSCIAGVLDARLSKKTMLTYTTGIISYTHADNVCYYILLETFNNLLSPSTPLLKTYIELPWKFETTGLDSDWLTSLDDFSLFSSEVLWFVIFFWNDSKVKCNHKMQLIFSIHVGDARRWKFKFLMQCNLFHRGNTIQQGLLFHSSCLKLTHKCKKSLLKNETSTLYLKESKAGIEFKHDTANTPHVAWLRPAQLCK